MTVTVIKGCYTTRSFKIVLEKQSRVFRPHRITFKKLLAILTASLTVWRTAGHACSSQGVFWKAKHNIQHDSCENTLYQIFPYMPLNHGHCPTAHGNPLLVGLDQIPFLVTGIQNQVLFILCQL